MTLPLLASAFSAQAQNFPFPDSAATWVQYYEVMVTQPPQPIFEWQTTANFCMDGSDTLIAGTSYTRLNYCNAGYVGGIRSVEEAVYFHPADSTQEYLLYDFGVDVGDTLYGVYVHEELGTGMLGWMNGILMDLVVVGSMPYAEFGGRKFVQVESLDGWASEWVEGIGCIHGLFAYFPGNVSGYWYGLYCMSYGDTTYWHGWYAGTPGACIPQYVGLNERETGMARLYPNPTNGLVRVEGVQPFAGIEVRDALGRSVNAAVSRLSSDALQVDLSAVPSGLYLISIAEGHVLGRVMRE